MEKPILKIMGSSTQPLVSVIIPFLNEDKFLPEAVESVMHQEYTNWELLLVDDGSFDGSVEIAKSFVARFPGKIKYCEHENHQNKGLSATRNAGIKQAQGELLAFLDADDVWLPGKLKNQVKIFQQNPGIAMVAEASEYWFSWNIPGKRNIVIPVGAPPEKVYEPGTLINYLYPLSKLSAPCPSGLMVTAKVVAKCGGFEESFCKKYQLYEDQAFLHKIYLNEKVYISSACQNKYRQREGSIVQWVKADGQYQNVRKFFLEWLENYIQQENLQTENTSNLLRKALLPYRKPVYFFVTNTLPQEMLKVTKKAIAYPFKHFGKRKTSNQFSHA